MKAILAATLLTVCSSLATAKCANMASGRMFDNTAVKHKVARTSVKKDAGTTSKNTEARSSSRTY